MRFDRFPSFWRSGLWLLPLWLLLILILNPLREFPLNDDWAYALSVKHFLATGTFDPGDWPGMTLLTQVLWGALWCKIFGFSFIILRCSTLFLAILGSWGFFKLSQQLIDQLSWNILLTLTLVFNPLYFSLSFTFMTDVPFVFLSLAAIFCYYRAFEGRGEKYWWMATLIVIAAVLHRQLALLWPVAFGAAWVLRHRSWRALILAGVAVLLSWLSLKGYVFVLKNNDLLSPTFGSFDSRIFVFTWHYLKYKWQDGAGLIFFNCAIFILPALVIAFEVKRKTQLLLLLFNSLLVFYMASLNWKRLPSGNVFFNTGIGPLGLANGNSPLPKHPLVPDLLIVLPGLVGAVFLLQIVLVNLPARLRGWKQWTPVMYWRLGLTLLIGANLLFIFLDNFQFDRYFLPLSPLMLLLLHPGKVSRFKRAAAITLLAAMALFSIAATQDHLQWNDTRWQALRDLMEEGIPPENIDGGFEFNGWYQTGPQNPFLKGSKSWWFVQEDEYAIGFGPFGCYEIQKSYPYRSMLRPGGDTLYWLHRPTFTERDTIVCTLENLSADSTHVISEAGQHLFEVPHAPDTTVAHSGHHALRLSPERPYGLTTYLSPVQPCEQLTFTLWNYGRERVEIIATTPNEQSFWISSPAFVDLTENGWQRGRFELTLPPDFPSDSLKVYLWNRKPQEIVVDDFEVVWRRR